MSFLMTHSVKIAGFRPLKANSLRWSRSVDDFSDTALIRLPAVCRMVKNGYTYDRLNTGEQFSEGTAVELLAGYDYKNVRRFLGFIRRINFGIPLEVECEGYSYLLRKLMFTRSYASTTVKALLQDLVQGTAIHLSDAIPEIPLHKIYFKNVERIKVLEYLKSKCLLTVYFNYEVLYVGLKQLEPKGTVKLRLGWNTIKDDGLKFETNKELAEVEIHIEARQHTGHLVTAKAQPKNKERFAGIANGLVKKKRVNNIVDAAVLEQLAETTRLKEVYRGYEGTITAFAEPYAEPGMAALITDSRYPERTGKYFIDKVTGEMGEGGGRQMIHISNALQ